MNLSKNAIGRYNRYKRHLEPKGFKYSFICEVKNPRNFIFRYILDNENERKYLWVDSDNLAIFTKDKDDFVYLNLIYK